ncbi:hypothetical protein P7C70_g1611, partial [Phenoliferia sp. Uapishka_3]
MEGPVDFSHGATSSRMAKPPWVTSMLDEGATYLDRNPCMGGPVDSSHGATSFRMAKPPQVTSMLDKGAKNPCMGGPVDSSHGATSSRMAKPPQVTSMLDEGAVVDWEDELPGLGEFGNSNGLELTAEFLSEKARMQAEGWEYVEGAPGQWKFGANGNQRFIPL